MLEAEFIDGGILRVRETIHSWEKSQVRVFYYDLDQRLKSMQEEGDVPSMAMTGGDVLWVQKYYVPLAEKQKAARDMQTAYAHSNPRAVDPNRYEMARRWSTLVTASLVADGSYDNLAREVT